MGCGTEREEEVGGAEDGGGNHGAIESELLCNGLGSSSCPSGLSRCNRQIVCHVFYHKIMIKHLINHMVKT